jgi:hypothetical protein
MSCRLADKKAAKMSKPNRRLSLSTRGLQQVNMKLHEQDFKFIAGGVSYRCPALIAEFLSPRVSRLRAMDPTILTFDLQTADPNHYFADLLSGAYGGHLDPKSEKAALLRSFCGELWNFEFVDLLTDSKDRMTRESLLPRLQFLSETGPESNYDVGVLAANFHLLQVSDCVDLDLQVLEGILSHADLVVHSEETLLELISARISRDSASYTLLECVKFEYLSTDGIKSAIELISGSFELFSYGIWNRLTQRLLLPVHPPKTDRVIVGETRAVDSRISPDFPSLFPAFSGKRFRLIYRGSEHGFQAADFHRTCDGHWNTVCLIRSASGFIFGGYTPLAWNSTGQWGNDQKGKGFLFTIKNPHNIPARIFPLNRDHRAYAIYGHGSYGPVFGSGNDLMLASAYNLTNGCNANVGVSYVNDTGIDPSLVLAGNAAVAVGEIEVFELTEGRSGTS